MDNRRRTVAASDGSALPVPSSTVRRPGPSAYNPRASVAVPPSHSMLSASVQASAGRYSMAPQRNVRSSMAPPGSSQQSNPYYGSSQSSQSSYPAPPATVGRTGGTYGGVPLGMSGGRGDAGYLRASHAGSSAQNAYVPPSERRSSQGRRQSTPSHTNTLQAFSQGVRPGLKDPRNLRNDPAARARCQAEVTEFLVSHRYPAEPKISQQAITQKDFEATFKFLYTLFDPSHGPWTGKFEDEVIKKCAPTSGYPFASEVNKSSLQTVGAKHSWHIILGLLHWLTTAVKVRDTAFELYPEVRIDAEAPDSHEALDRPQAKIEFWAEYLSRSYPLFLASEDYEQSLEPYHNRLKDRFDAYLDRSHQHIAELKEACELHEMELKKMETVPNELEIKQHEHEKLQKDLESLDNFMQTLDKRSKQVQKQLDEFGKRIRELEEAKAARETERAELKRQVNMQNLSDAEVQRLTTDRHAQEDLARSLADREAVTAREGAELQVELERVVDRVERHCDDYAARLSRHGLLPRPPTGSEYAHLDFAQELNGMASQPADIVPDPGKSAGVRPALIRMKQQAGAERNKHIDAALIVEAELGKLNERIAALVESLNEAEMEHATHRDELEAARETLTTEMTNATSELERRERENLDLRNNLSSGVLSADQRLQALDHEHTRLIAAVDRVRKDNSEALAESLEMIIGYRDFVTSKVNELYILAKES